MQVIGLCRFSYPALGGFQVMHETIEERCAFLYDPARLEQRFRYFETLTLPALRAQTDADFTFLVVIGDTLPAMWRDRLRDGLADVPQAILRELAPGRHREVMKAAINSVVEERDAPSLQFRLDDDDAVSIRLVERLREVAGECAGLIAANRHVAIDFNQGFIARPDADGLRAEPVIEPFNTAALAISVRPGVRQTIMNFSHHKLARNMPVITVPGEDMYIRGHSDMNDSRQKTNIRRYRLDLVTPEDEAHFRRVFAIDSDKVRRVFSDG